MFFVGMIIRAAAIYYLSKFVVFLFKAMYEHGYWKRHLFIGLCCRIFSGSICEYIKRFFLRAKQAPLNSYKITMIFISYKNNRIIMPFCSKPQRSTQQATERSKYKNAKIKGFLRPFSSILDLCKMHKILN